MTEHQTASPTFPGITFDEVRQRVAKHQALLPTAEQAAANLRAVFADSRFSWDSERRRAALEASRDD